MLMEIGEDLQREKQNSKKENSSIVDSLVKILTNSIVKSSLKEEMQKKYSQILHNNDKINYNILAKVAGKDYTILSFIDKGENCIKIPNILLPEKINRRTVLNYIDENFVVNQKQTEKNNKQWEKEQEKEEILKENRKYRVTWLANDFTEVIAEDTKQKYQFNFMQDYIPLNLQQQLKEGDSIVAKDGRFEKVGEILEENRVEDTYLGKVKEYTGKAKQIYMVTDVQSQVIKIQNIENKEEKFIKKEEIELEKGDFIQTKEKGYEKYDGIIPIKNEKIKKEIENLYNNIF